MSDPATWDLRGMLKPLPTMPETPEFKPGNWTQSSENGLWRDWTTGATNSEGELWSSYNPDLKAQGLMTNEFGKNVNADWWGGLNPIQRLFHNYSDPSYNSMFQQKAQEFEQGLAANPDQYTGYSQMYGQFPVNGTEQEKMDYMRWVTSGGGYVAQQQGRIAEDSGWRGFAGGGGGLATMLAGGVMGAMMAPAIAASGLGSSYIGQATSLAKGFMNDNPLSGLGSLAGMLGGSWGVNPTGGGMGDFDLDFADSLNLQGLEAGDQFIGNELMGGGSLDTGGFGDWMPGMTGGADFSGNFADTMGDQTFWTDTAGGGGGFWDSILSGAKSLGSGALSVMSKLFGGGGAKGSGMWGTGASLLSLLSGLGGYPMGRDLENTATGLRNSVDANMGNRHIAAGHMQTLMNDPSRIIDMPGFQAGQLAINRNLAKLGYLPATTNQFDQDTDWGVNPAATKATIPGNYLDAHSNFAGKMYGDEMERLGKIAGIGFDPSNAAALQLKGLEGNVGVTGATTNRTAAGLYGLLSNLFS